MCKNDKSISSGVNVSSFMEEIKDVKSFNFDNNENFMKKPELKENESPFVYQTKRKHNLNLNSDPFVVKKNKKFIGVNTLATSSPIKFR